MSTPLHKAAEIGDIEAIITLIQQGADVHAKYKHGYTPLHLAAEQGRVDVIDILVKDGADVNARL